MIVLALRTKNDDDDGFAFVVCQPNNNDFVMGEETKLFKLSDVVDI